MAKRKRRRSSSKSVPKTVTASSSSGSTCMCCGASRGTGWLILIVGILFLLHDLGGVRWWTVNWLTILFLLSGLIMIRK